MAAAESQVAKKFADFERDREPLVIQEAVSLLEGADRTGDLALREQALSPWLLLLSLLESAIDPTWDVKNAPAQGVAPPPVHEVVFPSGEVDPSTISDAAERAEYERALKANKDALREYDVQLQLRRIEEGAIGSVERLLAERYGSSEHDRRELEGLLARSNLSEARREQLRTFTLDTPS